MWIWHGGFPYRIGFIRDSNPREHMPQHGPFAEVVIAAVQDLTGERFVLWATLRLVRRWERGHRVADGAVLGLWLGVAASIRVSAVIWYGVLAVAAGWWVCRSRSCWPGRR